MVAFSHSIIRVAVWNLAGFNLFEPGSGIPPDSNRALNQAEGLALLDAEIVTLVEVSPLSHIDRLAELLRDEYGLDYEVTILPQPVSPLHIGFLHKAVIELSNARFVEGSEGDYDGGRRAIAVDLVIGRFRATIIGVHLKSGRDAADQARRDTQCIAIGNYIADLRATPGYMTDAILLLGDFNMIPGQDVSNFHHLGGDDLMDFISSWDLQERWSHIQKRGRANLLDGFAISRTYSKAYIRGSLRLFPMHWTMNNNGNPPGMGRDTFKREVSDHLPFVASFRIF
ncbi:MAG: GMP synthase [Paracoccaceae bacterium]|nr:GMP synthase [Paracoccaceae bacterium]